MIEANVVEAAVVSILKAIGEEPTREGLRDTPRRVARMYAELFSGIGLDPRAAIDTVFEEERHDDAVQQYRLAAEAGNAWSMLTLGRLGVRAEDDAGMADGVTWLQRAAEAGNETAAGLLEGLEELDPLARAHAVRERLDAEEEGE